VVVYAQGHDCRRRVFDGIDTSGTSLERRSEMMSSMKVARVAAAACRIRYRNLAAPADGASAVGIGIGIGLSHKQRSEVRKRSRGSHPARPLGRSASEARQPMLASRSASGTREQAYEESAQFSGSIGTRRREREV